jgi:hypothetical protein
VEATISARANATLTVQQAVEATVAARMTEASPATPLPVATATQAAAAPQVTLPAAGQETAVGDPLTALWRQDNLRFAETIATKTAGVAATARAWAAEQLSDDDAKRTLLEGITYMVDVLKYRAFLDDSAKKNLRLFEDEVNAIASLRNITADDGACAQAIGDMSGVTETADQAARSAQLLKFAADWERVCSGKAAQAVEVLRARSK